MQAVLAQAVAAAGQGARAALVTVIATSGSTPRHAGARMLVHEDGRIAGTIGGGRIEHEVVERARQVAALAVPAGAHARHLTRELAMCCGGGMTMWIEPVDRTRAQAWQAALAELAARRPATLTISDDAGQAVHVDTLEPPPRAVLFGGGHVALAVAPLLVTVGFEVVVCDDDERFASPARFPGARCLATFDVADVRAELGGLGADDHVLILTRDHAIDQEIVACLVGDRGLGSLGLIGSRGKVERFKRRLVARDGVAAEDWARLHAPVGLDIGAETPEEIAVAIVAELIAHRRRKSGRTP
jgi:xanthine dehydrogenase accessory factor